MPRRWLIFALSSALFFLSQFYRVSNAVIAPQLLHDLSIDTKGLGLISASFFYGFAFFLLGFFECHGVIDVSPHQRAYAT